MNDRFDDLPVLEELRGYIEEAAFRSTTTPARKVTPGAARRKWAVPAVAAALLLAGVAGAATLLATGSSVMEPAGKSARYRSAVSRVPTVDVTSRDPRTGVIWGVAAYKSRNGQDCVIAGEVRGGSLGIVAGRLFHPYGKAVSGPCGDLGKDPVIGDARYFAQADRTLIYGRARTPGAAVVFTARGRSYRAPAGNHGTFMLLFRGKLSIAGTSLTVATRQRTSATGGRP